MNQQKTTVVTTTIYTPTLLKAYAENAEHYGHEVDFIVVADLKTPGDAAQFCDTIRNCNYMSVMDQNKYMQKFPELNAHLPFNSIARRNIGHLLAYESGADTIIMLDDDNLATSHDFVRHHETGIRPSLVHYASSSGWYNVCDALNEKHGVRFYARGYPPSQRWNDGIITEQGDTRRVAVNAGLWINDPDIDAITRLERRLVTTGMNRYRFALYPGTWSPWNCQNTAISRAALPSYFLSPYTGRHLDIWASYITTKCTEAMGEVITFGTPLAFHERSPHNLYRDLEQELPWIEATDEFVRVLRDMYTFRVSYKQALVDVAAGLSLNWEHPVKQKYLEGIAAWVSAFDRLGA